jgi:hypothetical protein
MDEEERLKKIQSERALFMKYECPTIKYHPSPLSLLRSRLSRLRGLVRELKRARWEKFCPLSFEAEGTVRRPLYKFSGYFILHVCGLATECSKMMHIRDAVLMGAREKR